jgi:uncharacterized protein (DUF2141 family)
MRIRHFAPLLLVLTGAAAPATLELDVHGMRNARGVFHVCVTAQQKHFPDCSKDRAAIKRTVPAGSRSLLLAGLAPGRYAVTLFHDENNNQRLDTLLGIPREGFGFSRNPVVRFGAPKFRQVDIQLAPGINRQALRLQYLL